MHEETQLSVEMLSRKRSKADDLFDCKQIVVMSLRSKSRLQRCCTPPELRLRGAECKTGFPQDSAELDARQVFSTLLVVEQGVCPFVHWKEAAQP